MLIDTVNVNCRSSLFLLKTTRIEVLYWKLQEDSSATFPLFGFYDLHDKPYYGQPSYEYPGLVKVCVKDQTLIYVGRNSVCVWLSIFNWLQVCFHTGSEVDPDQRDLNTAQSNLEGIQSFIEKYFSGVSTSPSICEPCMYTVSQDNSVYDVIIVIIIPVLLNRTGRMDYPTKHYFETHKLRVSAKISNLFYCGNNLQFHSTKVHSSSQPIICFTVTHNYNIKIYVSNFYVGMAMEKNGRPYIAIQNVAQIYQLP